MSCDIAVSTPTVSYTISHFETSMSGRLPFGGKNTTVRLKNREPFSSNSVWVLERSTDYEQGWCIVLIRS